jgi:hypothetical protein
MKAKFNSTLSWEKQSVYDLENGTRATVEWSMHYGPYVKRIDNPDGALWCASDGLDPDYANDPCESVRRIFAKHIRCPDFARAWIEDVRNSHGTIALLVRPLFTIDQDS